MRLDTGSDLQFGRRAGGYGRVPLQSLEAAGLRAGDRPDAGII